MLPSRKILFGASLLFTSVLLQFLIAQWTRRAVESMTASVKSVQQNGSATSGVPDSLLEQTHSQMETAFTGQIMAMVLLVVGLLLLLIGVFQVARLAEETAHRTRGLCPVPPLGPPGESTGPGSSSMVER